MQRPVKTLMLAFVFLGYHCPVFAQSSPISDRIKDLITQAEVYESQRAWTKAMDACELALQLDRAHPEARRLYLHALRRVWQQQRLQDNSYSKKLFQVEYSDALQVFQVVFETLLDGSVDRKTIQPDQLLQRGIEELRFALSSPEFINRHIAPARQGRLNNFRNYLDRVSISVTGLNRTQILKNVRDIAITGQRMLRLKAQVSVLEMACGSCYALDQYTAYLTPLQLQTLYASLRGEYVGVGITLGFQDGKLIIADIAGDSPAGELMPALQLHDQVLRISGKETADMQPEAALALLEGPAGSQVEFEVYTPGLGLRTLKLRRRAVFVPSVAYQMQTETVGYLQIVCFQESTLQEMDEALVALSKSGMKALVLDLRGNSGGLFDVAVEVARRFVANGVIVSTEHQDPRSSTIYYARNPAAFGMPLVVLVDADTASSAEIVAGALKGNKRGRLVGQTTFGKGCTQSIFRLPAVAGIPTGGLRITVARFFSPEGIAFSGRGIHPHQFVERYLMPGSMNMIDHQLEEAIVEAQRLGVMLP